MNTETAQLYQTAQEILDAQARGEPLAMLSPKAAAVVAAGHKTLAKKTKKQKRKMAKESKRRNRKK